MDIKKYLAPYLPYKLNCICHTGYDGSLDIKEEMIAIGEGYITYRNTCYQYIDVVFSDMKPLLKPISLLNTEYQSEVILAEHILYDLNSDYNHLCEEWLHSIDYYITKENIISAPAFIFNHLISKHFDVYDLIDQNIALDISKY